MSLAGILFLIVMSFFYCWCFFDCTNMFFLIRLPLDLPRAYRPALSSPAAPATDSFRTTLEKLIQIQIPLIWPCPEWLFQLLPYQALRSKVLWCQMLATVLLAGYWSCPKELQRFTFVSPAHTPHYPLTPAVNSSILTAGFLSVRFCTQMFEKNDVLKKNGCSTRMRKVISNPPKMQPYPLLSWERLPLVRTIFDWNVRENGAMSLHRGERDHCYFVLCQTYPQTWPRRTMSDLTCILPVRMCKHSLGFLQFGRGDLSLIAHQALRERHDASDPKTQRTGHSQIWGLEEMALRKCNILNIFFNLKTTQKASNMLTQHSNTTVYPKNIFRLTLGHLI